MVILVPDDSLIYSSYQANRRHFSSGISATIKRDVCIWWSLMGLHQLVGSTCPRFSLLCFHEKRNICIWLKQSSFFLAKCCHLKLCLHRMEPNKIYQPLNDLAFKISNFLMHFCSDFQKCLASVETGSCTGTEFFFEWPKCILLLLL